MAMILNIETSTKNCSVSLTKDGETIAIKEINNGNYSHAELLHPSIQEVCQNAHITLKNIDALAVGKGPGSYTGLRIGVSAAKGICFAIDKPLIAINSLEILANSVSEDTDFIIPMIDARRMEVYSAVYDGKMNLLQDTSATIIYENSFQQFLTKGKTVLLGDGAEKCKEVLKGENILYLEDKFPSAKEMAKLSFQKFKNQEFEDVAYFEPFYLKDFIVTKEKSRL